LEIGDSSGVEELRNGRLIDVDVVRAGPIGVQMEVFEAVKTMLAIRSYEDKAIAEESVARILEAARLTASSQNKQMWDFVVIQERERLQQLGQLARSGPYIADAALAIAVVVPERTVGAIDGARAVQDMMLVAWEMGIGSNWVGNVNTVEIKKLLAVPEEHMLLTVVPFGYPRRKVGKGQKRRKALAEIAHSERFGETYGD
jgi:nitroreductase